MCTVTLVRTEAGFRLLCNRDEQRTRAPSTSLQSVECDGRRAVFPIDPVSGGTWIGASEEGLVCCLLNSTPGECGAPASTWSGSRSRGVVVPQLLGASTLSEAIERCGTLRVQDFPPFQLLLASADAVWIAVSDAARLSSGDIATMPPTLMLTSSGLGDGLVAPPREELFRRMFGRELDVSATQDSFHAHAWSEAPHLSVLMSRSDARTVSRTGVECKPGGLYMWHEQLSEEGRVTERSDAALPRPGVRL